MKTPTSKTTKDEAAKEQARAERRARIKAGRFPKTPMCELLRDKAATHFTHRRGKWMFVSTEAPEDDAEYHFEIARFFASPAATVAWLAHLSEKGWFDAEDFVRMMRRFRAATNSYFAV